MNNDTTCGVPDCDRGLYAISARLCSAHYQQRAAGKPFTTPRPQWHGAGAPCSFAGCENISTLNSLCRRHYDQDRKGKGLTPLKRPKMPVARRNDAGEKWCTTCESWRPEADYASSKGTADGLQSRCKPCNAAIYRENAEKVRDKMRQQRFGITREQFDALFESQGNVCATCGTDNPGTSYWAVDHDHACCPGSDKTCGKCIRGILCRTCNHALGNVKDNHQTLARMIDYLAEGTIDVGSA